MILVWRYAGAPGGTNTGRGGCRQQGGGGRQGRWHSAGGKRGRSCASQPGRGCRRSAKPHQQPGLEPRCGARCDLGRPVRVRCERVVRSGNPWGSLGNSRPPCTDTDFLSSPDARCVACTFVDVDADIDRYEIEHPPGTTIKQYDLADGGASGRGDTLEGIEKLFGGGGAGPSYMSR